MWGMHGRGVSESGNDFGAFGIENFISKAEFVWQALTQEGSERRLPNTRECWESATELERERPKRSKVWCSGSERRPQAPPKHKRHNAKDADCKQGVARTFFEALNAHFYLFIYSEIHASNDVLDEIERVFHADTHPLAVGLAGEPLDVINLRGLDLQVRVTHGSGGEVRGDSTFTCTGTIRGATAKNTSLGIVKVGDTKETDTGGATQHSNLH